MVTYKLDNTLVAKYPTSEERRASNNNNETSANKDHDGQASAKKRANTLSTANVPERGPKI